MGRKGDALTPDIRRNWNSLMTFIFLFIWAALLAMKKALKSRRSQQGKAVKGQRGVSIPQQID